MIVVCVHCSDLLGLRELQRGVARSEEARAHSSTSATACQCTPAAHGCAHVCSLASPVVQTKLWLLERAHTAACIPLGTRLRRPFDVTCWCFGVVLSSVWLLDVMSAVQQVLAANTPSVSVHAECNASGSAAHILTFHVMATAACHCWCG